jgi:carbamoyltransferase
MNFIGISNGFHDAAVSLIDDRGNILFAGHSERYSKIKNDPNLNVHLITDVLKHSSSGHDLHYYERPYLRFLRSLRSGEPLDFSVFSKTRLIGKEVQKRLGKKKLHYHNHHLSHAAAGFQTSPFNNATVLIIDAIGEFDTISIWDADYDRNGKAIYKNLYTKKYPNSLGLFYSAMTQHVGLHPMDEEYIMMGMAAYGNPTYTEQMFESFVYDKNNFEFKENLHTGIDERHSFLHHANEMDIAASAQKFLEEMLEVALTLCKEKGYSNNLVYGGGVALNCLANRILGKYFDKVWIMPNPGDAGSSLGAAALGYGRNLNWKNAYLGHNIKGHYPTVDLYDELKKNKIVGVASGRAEFGPRALGNRSLLADPRGNEIKDKVNEIKRRQKFRRICK